jgi:hypothetical protein
VLAVTLTAGFAVDEGRAGVRELLLAAIGCNVAGESGADQFLFPPISPSIRRGPLIALSHGSLDFATYRLDPGSRNAIFVLSVARNLLNRRRADVSTSKANRPMQMKS